MRSEPEYLASNSTAIGPWSRWTILVIDYVSIPVAHCDVEAAHYEGVVNVLLLIYMLQFSVGCAKVLGQVATAHTPVNSLVHFVVVLLPDEVWVIGRPIVVNGVLDRVENRHVVPFVFSEVVVVREVLLEDLGRVFVYHVGELVVNAIQTQKLLHSLRDPQKRDLTRMIRYVLLEECVLNFALFDHQGLKDCYSLQNDLVEVVQVAAVLEATFNLLKSERLFGSEMDVIFGHLRTPIISMRVTFRRIIVFRMKTRPINSLREISS